MTANQEPGQREYAAFLDLTGGKDGNGLPAPPWSRMNATAKGIWERAERLAEESKSDPDVKANRISA